MASALSLETKIKLNSGHEIPLLGFGVWQTPEDVAEDVCIEAMNIGYRHIDCAAVYKNEAGCGAAIRKIADTIPRDQIFFTSKVPGRSLSYENAKAQVAKTLALTGLEYVDLMLLHAPYGGSAARKAAWKGLVECVEEGTVRSIGVSNYGVHHLDELDTHIKELEAERGGPGKGGVLSVGQWEIHPWCAREDIAAWCRARGVAVEAYSPLVRGERWGEPVLKKLADKYAVTEAQILIRWSLQKGYVPLPKSVTPARIKQNTEVYSFELTPDEVKELQSTEYKPVCWDPNVSPLDN
ncbi:putative aldehyde reductase [Cryphonectria parasitica EP155]|uniref:Aldehyde reductase n=1 Tax=Cryphonectria parasitica (strain ATCC 38755 / EP155) TaxID=660469 RepID=A0A9P4XYB3_CRYP1|nr:putative aldehyde reductase [Cryphonectria parasitica EP155]KAF3763539.1 putative aldehyde reductase [Cryphonectria parasitica EP155]